jgi:hypothetical protein
MGLLNALDNFILRWQGVFEVWVPTGAAQCSGDECPCGAVGAEIPRGEGFLIITPQIVAFRRRAPSMISVMEEAGKMAENQRRAIAQRIGLPSHSQIALMSSGKELIVPLLVCERSPKLNWVNRDVARADAIHMWESGRVPLRPTPFR